MAVTKRSVSLIEISMIRDESTSAAINDTLSLSIYTNLLSDDYLGEIHARELFHYDAVFDTVTRNPLLGTIYPKNDAKAEIGIK